MTTLVPLRLRRRQSGYALLIVLFFTALLALSAMAVAPNILTEGKREKELEMIWRGKQYTRGVKMHYRKLGRFPTSLDDLTKPKTGTLRFMRQAYKDPTNKEDGEWRLIYVGPAGNLIGSLKPPQNISVPQGGGGLGTPAAGVAAASGQQPSSGFGQSGSSFGGSGFGQNNPPGMQPPGSQQGPGTGPAGGPGGTPPPCSATDNPATSNCTPAPDSSQPQSINPDGNTTIIGGNIIGVGGKVDQKSVIIYEKGKTYRLFEFIWDPSKDNFGVGQPGLQTGTGLGQTPGTTPGQNPGQSPFGAQPTPGPGGTPPHPPPNQTPPQQ
jgi:hypothetical protein